MSGECICGDRYCTGDCHEFQERTSYKKQFQTKDPDVFEKIERDMINNMQSSDN